MRKTGGKLLDFARMLVLLGTVAALSAFLANYSSEEFAGSAKIIDGDSLEVAGTEIRLFGIDAPEYTQRCSRQSSAESFDCGKEAVIHLRRLIGGQDVVCDGWDTDKYERRLATCSVGETNINEQMVADGWAVAFGKYEQVEQEAKRAKRGLWAGEFVSPSQWRRETREAHRSSLFQLIKFW